MNKRLMRKKEKLKTLSKSTMFPQKKNLVNSRDSMMTKRKDLSEESEKRNLEVKRS